MHFFPQGPLAIGSFVFEDDDADRVSRVLHALPYPRERAEVRVEWFEEHPGVLAAVRDVFPVVTVMPRRNAEFNDRIAIVYKSKVGRKLPSATISVMVHRRFCGAPIVGVHWGSPRRGRDIDCGDVLGDYLRLAEETRCRCSVLAIEQSIVQIGHEFIIPVSPWVGAVTCGGVHARDTDPNFDEVVGMIRRSVRTIGGLRCRVE